jgi:hypothetical protein
MQPVTAPSSLIVFKLVALAVLYAYIPLSALTYYLSRRRRRVIEVDRLLTLLKIDPAYRRAYAPDSATSYLGGVLYLSTMACIGLTLLFFSHEIGLVNGDFPLVKLGDVEFPQQGSRLVFAMAFLGVYLSSLQHIYRRYATTDLSPTVYYAAAMRMITAAIFALVIYNGYTALSGGGESDGGVTAAIWPALAFLIGVFPQQGLRWLTDKLPMFSRKPDSLVRSAPLEMIEGVEDHDVLRLEEYGIDTCYDLATADFVPLVLRTPYSPRQLIDWILQAKLCVHFGETVKDLRRLGIRTIVDLELLSEDEIQALPSETSVTAPVLQRAREAVVKSAEIHRLRELGQMLGMFWNRPIEPIEPEQREPHAKAS